MVSRKIWLTYKLRLFYIHSKSLISDSLKNNANNQELWQHWPTVLNDNIWPEMNSARFVCLECVVGCRTHFHLTLLIYVILGSEDVRACSSWMTWSPKCLHPWRPPTPHSSAPSFTSFWLHLTPMRKIQLFCACALESVYTMGEGSGLSLLCVQVEVRSLREKKREGRHKDLRGNDREGKLTSIWLFSLICLTKFMLTLPVFNL